MFRITSADGSLIGEHSSERMAHEIAQGYVASMQADAIVVPLKLNTKTGEIEADEKQARTFSVAQETMPVLEEPRKIKAPLPVEESQDKLPAEDTEPDA